MIEEKIKSVIRDVPDFPKPGIVFKDITPILLKPELCQEIIDEMKNKIQDWNVDAIAGVESRGFIFGLPLSIALNVPFIMIRKKGKLPFHTVSHKYDLEYGSAEIEVHVDAIEKGQNIVVHDDLLATGGTAAATAELITKQGGTVAGFSFLVELAFLKGNEKLLPYSKNIQNLVSY